MMGNDAELKYVFTNEYLNSLFISHYMYTHNVYIDNHRQELHTYFITTKYLSTT